MTIEETKAGLRKYIGENSIHGLGIRDGSKIHVYHEAEIPQGVKASLETEASPYTIEYHQEAPPETN